MYARCMVVQYSRVHMAEEEGEKKRGLGFKPWLVMSGQWSFSDRRMRPRRDGK